MRGKDMFNDMAIEELRGQIEHFCGLGDRVIEQACRRVLSGRRLASHCQSRSAAARLE